MDLSARRSAQIGIKVSNINVNQLRQGMILGASVFHPESKKLLLKQGTRLVNAYIEKLVELRISEVDISDPFTVFLDIRENMEYLLNDCFQSMRKKIVPDSREGNMNDEVIKIIPEVQKMVDKICADPGVRDICVDMQVIDFEALVRTGVFASGYSMMLAALFGLPEQEILNIGTAALIHDVGMCEMYQLIREKEISEANRSLWEQHSTYGYYMMIEKNFSREIAELIYAHHEKYNGEGFPRKLKGEEIPIGSRIIAVCADYEEAVRNRGFLQYEAMEYIYGNSGRSYDPAVVEAFSRNIPVYPLGSVVQLSTGEIGVVVNIRKNKGPRPVVRVQYNRVYKPISESKLVDLGEQKTVFIKKLISY